MAIHDFGGFGMSDELPFNAEAIAAALAHAATAQGDAASVAALAVAVPRLRVTGEGYWVNDRLGPMDVVSLYLEVPAEAFGQLFHVREDVQRRIGDMFRPIISAHRMYQGSDVFIVPADDAPSDWRKQALAWLRGEGITNQGRVRSDNIAAREYEGLLFRSR
jgi:hypothetical protein